MEALNKKTILSARDVEIQFSLRGDKLTAIRGCSLDLYEGETLAIVGESGSGKSVFTKSFLGMLDQNGSITGGSIMYEGNDLAKYTTEKEWRTIRGKKISMVMQDPMTSLNPVFTIGYQLDEVSFLHNPELSKEEVKAYSIEMLKKVGISMPERFYAAYPHELSGGMRQRVMIAMALAGNPKLIIADEPTTALDVTIQAQILELLKDLQANQGCSIMLITHDLGVIAEMADEVVVMYAGKVIERGSAKEIFHNPLHPYTMGLQKSKPLITSDSNAPLYSIPGQVPNPINLPNNCYFKNRCGKCTGKCSGEYPKEIKINDEHYVSCYLYEE